MQAGLHGLWSVYRGKRRGREGDASIFMLEKKLWDKKKSECDLNSVSPTMKEDSLSVLKKDPANLVKLRHPSILNLLEQPGEDEKFLVFITEPVEYSLACLAEAYKGKDHLRDKIPSTLEIKCMTLELLEALNFMHQNAKCVHAGLSPENLYVTKAGKLKIAGLNFCSPMGTEEHIALPV
jgi:SCY1-like protein 2